MPTAHTTLVPLTEDQTAGTEADVKEMLGRELPTEVAAAGVFLRTFYKRSVVDCRAPR